MIYLYTENEYNYVVGKGANPLLDYKNYTLDIHLRVELQKKLFGRGRIDTARANAKFYRWMWANKPHFCEETMRPLRSFSATYISHILSRGGYPEMATDPRNINILCYEAHARWENGDRQNMRIWEKNQKIIDMLISEYNELRKI